MEPCRGCYRCCRLPLRMLQRHIPYLIARRRWNPPIIEFFSAAARRLSSCSSRPSIDASTISSPTDPNDDGSTGARERQGSRNEFTNCVRCHSQSAARRFSLTLATQRMDTSSPENVLSARCRSLVEQTVHFSASRLIEGSRFSATLRAPAPIEPRARSCMRPYAFYERAGVVVRRY